MLSRWRRQRAWRRGRMALDGLGQHALAATGAELDPHWDQVLFPADLPELHYPHRVAGHLGHPMIFPASFAHSESERRSLDRLMTVLVHQNPDVEYCPLLVHVVAFLLKCTDAALAYAIGQAMINRSRKRTAAAIWAYCPLTVHGFLQAVHALRQLCGYQGPADDLRPLLSGDVLSYFPLPAQCQILACLFAEGYKIMYRMAIVSMIASGVAKADRISYPDLQRYASEVSLDQHLKAMFRYRLRRSTIAYLIDAAPVQYGQRHDMDRDRQIRHWPDIERHRSVSHVVPIQVWVNVWAFVLPTRLTHSALRMIFCSANDGCSFSTVVRRVQDAPGPCSIVVQDGNNGDILGVCLPAGLRPGISSNPETIVFSHAAGKFHHWSLPQSGDAGDHSTMVGVLDKSLSFVFGKEQILRISEDLLSAIANPVFYGQDLRSGADSSSVSVKHLEIIAHH